MSPVNRYPEAKVLVATPVGGYEEYSTSRSVCCAGASFKGGGVCLVYHSQPYSKTVMRVALSPALSAMQCGANAVKWAARCRGLVTSPDIGWSRIML